MGVSTNLIINQKYGVREIRTLLEKGMGIKVAEVVNNDDHSFIRMDLGEEILAQMYVARTNSYGGLDATVLSFGSRPVTTELLRRIARVTGGMFQADDCGDDWVSFQDPHTENSMFVLRQGILRNCLTGADSKNLTEDVAKAAGYRS
jgi:hypothetical protein